MTQSEQTVADPASAILNIVTDLGRQLAQSAKTLTETRDDEVEIGTAAKDEVWRSDKVILYRYKAIADRKLKTPLLVVFSLVGRY